MSSLFMTTMDRFHPRTRSNRANSRVTLTLKAFQLISECKMTFLHVLRYQTFPMPRMIKTLNLVYILEEVKWHFQFYIRCIIRKSLLRYNLAEIQTRSSLERYPWPLRYRSIRAVNSIPKSWAIPNIGRTFF